MRSIAHFLSALFHPLLFPTYGAVYITFFAPHFFAQLSPKALQLSVIVIFILTFIFPVVSLMLMRKLDLIPSLTLEDKKDRVIPFISIATFYIWTFFYYKPSYRLPFANPLIASMMLGSVIATFVAFFINIFRKISLHTIAAGGWIGFMLGTMQYTVYDIGILIPLFVVLAGLIGTARLILKAHEPKEIIQGYLVGFVSQFVAFTIVPYFQLLFNN
jgi:hypothetical protein